MKLDNSETPQKHCAPDDMTSLHAEKARDPSAPLFTTSIFTSSGEKIQSFFRFFVKILIKILRAAQKTPETGGTFRSAVSMTFLRIFSDFTKKTVARSKNYGKLLSISGKLTQT